ncbi:MAG TPA: c-type cytochrome [Bryobacteraceae bacterium]|nr:c-type cytochrome [Bryobacteraceae bacterium]
MFSARLAIATAAIASAVTVGCSRNTIAAAEGISAGRAGEGRHLLYSYGCGSCHVIPGISEATGTVGPPLAGLANRQYIAGLLVNTPENLFRWIRQPQQIEPGSAMPNLNVTEQQAHDMAAYLYTLH